MNDYDLIIIGAGISSLIAANIIQKEGKKVLVLEKNSTFSPLNNGVIKGRFVFNSSISEVGYYNGNDDYIDYLLKRIGITDLNYLPLKEAFRLISKDESGHRLDYVMPFGIDNFIAKMEEYVPGSSEFIRTYFDLAEECDSALRYIIGSQGKPNMEVMKIKYENFMKVSTYSHSEVMDVIGVPLHAQEILNTYWLNLGSSETEVSFVQYAVSLFEYIRNGVKVLGNGNYELLIELTNNFVNNGGEIKYNSWVNKILVDGGKVKGVSLIDGTSIMANHVIFNGSLHDLYGNLIDEKMVPVEAIKNCNQKTLGLRRFTVQLGLNRSNVELGINNYNYYIYDSLDSDLEYKKMNSLRADNIYCRCLNVVNENVSPKGTTILELNTFFSGSVFEEDANESTLESIKHEIASNMIKLFESKLKIKVKPYIEEISIISPLDYYLMNGNYAYGYKMSGYNNMLYRYFNIPNERYIQGLYNCGSFDCFGSTMDGIYLSGGLVANLTLIDMAGE